MKKVPQYSAVLISVAVSFFFVSLTVFGATTLSTNVSVTAGGTLDVNGLSTLYGGFLTASSTATSTLMVSGVLQASSTVLTGSGLTTFGSGGFITTSSSTAVTTLRVNGAFVASSTLQATGNAFLFGTLGVGATTTLAQEVGIVGDILQDSAATTTHVFSSSGSGKGGCLQMKGTNGAWFRLYATSSAGYAYFEAGECQAAN